MSKKIVHGQKAKKQLKKGVDALANAVKVTLGPQGRNVMIERAFGDPGITKDGISVAREVVLPNRLQNMGAQFVKAAASKTNEKAGDGTTTASVLTQSLIKLGMRLISNGHNPVAVQRGIKIGAELLIDELKKLSVEIGNEDEELNQIAFISSNNDEEIGELVGMAYAKVGKEGVISVEQSKDTTTHVDLAEGMKFGSGYISPYFVNDKKKGEVHLEDVYVLMCEDKLNSFGTPLKNILDKSIGQGKSLLIIGDVEGQALETLVVNAYEGQMKVAIVKPPAFGERRKAYLEDIQTVLGGKIVSKERGKYLNKVTSDDFGKCDSVRIDFHDTILIGGKGEPEIINFRVEEIESLMVSAENDYETNDFKKRIASLKGGVGVIYVGAPTETEMKEKMDRVEDSKNATKAALEEGIVSGGGVAYLQARAKVDLSPLTGTLLLGAQLVLKAVESPIRCIAENAGAEGSVVIANVLKSRKKNSGFNARNNSYEADMIEAGIIDPVKVTRIALENAASAAGMLLTTECTITTLMEKNPPMPQGQGGSLF